MLSTVKKSAERLYTAAVHAGSKDQDYHPLNFSAATGLNNVRFGVESGDLVMSFGNARAVRMPLGQIKDPSNRDSVRQFFRGLLSDLKTMQEYRIVVDGQVNKTALESLQHDVSYLMSDGHNLMQIYFNGVESESEGEPSKMWFRIKRGFIYTDHWLDLGKAREGINISLYTPPSSPECGKSRPR